MTDSQGRTWHVMERDDGSICVYYTLPDTAVHFVVYDSLNEPLPHREDVRTLVRRSVMEERDARRAVVYGGKR